MRKTREILKLTCKGGWKVVYDYTAETNPFIIYYFWRDGSSGHRKLMERYGDLRSCLVYLANVMEGVERCER